MAYRNKRHYDYRREAAISRNLTNEEIAVEHGMTQEQTGLISKLCAMRHEFHCALDSLTKDGEGNYEEWMNLEQDFTSASLPGLNVYDQLCDIDDINGLMYDYGDDVPPHDSSEFQRWYDGNYERIYDELSGVNTYIERYLAEIDKQYGTSWCPSGVLRIY